MHKVLTNVLVCLLFFFLPFLFFCPPSESWAAILSSIISHLRGRGAAESSPGKWTKQNIHIFKLDLQHLTESCVWACARVRQRPVYSPSVLHYMWVPEQINEGGPLYFFGSMLIARNNIKDVWFLCLSILHYNKFSNITREHSLLRRGKVETG